MWIIPKPITSAFVPDTEALISDLGEQSHAFAQSLIQRSKVTPAPTWLRRLRQDSWIQLLSGRMLRASHTDSFTAAYTSSLGATLANPSQQLGSDLAGTTPVTSGLGSQMELLSCDPACASSRTSKDTLPLGCVTCSTTWESWVKERRGAYSRRLKLALLTRGRESSPWPTPTASEDKDQNASFGTLARLDKGGRILRRIATLTIGQASQENHDTIGNLRRQLNPRWVETLMGVPVGWTMATCSHPLAIEPMNSGFSETVLYQPQQPSLSQPS